MNRFMNFLRNFDAKVNKNNYICNKNRNIMEEMTLRTTIQVAQLSELSETDRQLIDMAIEGTNRSYAPYSHFHVGSALMLKNGKMFIGCNQENAAFPAGLCAERSAIFAAGAQYPEEPVVTLAITARNSKGDPIYRFDDETEFFKLSE